jgi:hypothetical protein
MPMPSSPIARLDAFRTELHACYIRRADALFELGDALLCAEAVSSLPHLSLEPVHQRGWGSVYAALVRGHIDAERLGDLLVSSLPTTDPTRPPLARSARWWAAWTPAGVCCSSSLTAATSYPRGPRRKQTKATKAA